MEQQNGVNSSQSNHQPIQQAQPLQNEPMLILPGPSKLNKITEEKSGDFLKSFNSSGSDHLLSFDSSNSPNTTITSVDSSSRNTNNNNTDLTNNNISNSSNKAASKFLSSFLSSRDNINLTNIQNESMPAEVFINESPQIVLNSSQKSTKSIIKPAPQQQQQNSSSSLEYTQQTLLPSSSQSEQSSKRVNFDPHALLLGICL